VKYELYCLQYLLGFIKLEIIKGYVIEYKRTGKFMERQYYYSFDFVKFICAVAVVLIHVSSQIVIHDLNNFWNYNVYRPFLNLAVPFFFLSSGFFLSLKIKSAYDLNIIISYSKKIFYLFLYFSIFYIFVRLTFVISDAIFIDRPIDTQVIKYFKTLTFQSILSGSIGSFHLWFLSSLIYSSLLLGLFIKFRISEKWLITSAFFVYLVVYSGIIDLPKFFNYGGISIGFLYICLGYYLGNIDVSRFKYPFLFFSIFGILYFLTQTEFRTHLTGIFLFLTTFYLGVLCKKNSKFGMNHIFTKLSKFALDIYILHIFVQLVLIKFYTYFGFNDFYLWKPHYFIALFLCVFIPMLIFKPIINFMEKFKSNFLFED
jgi:Acyltransferase family